jgi:hypothetical protein
MGSKPTLHARALCIVGLVLLASTAVHPQSPAEAITEPEAYAVYASLMPKLKPARASGTSRIVIQAESVTDTRCALKGKPLENEWRVVLDDFNRENARVRKIVPNFPPMALPYRIVNSAEIQSAFEANGWEGFHAMYPNAGGYYRVSAVGFNEAKTWAMVYVEYGCGYRCGNGQVYLLEKRDGQWVGAKAAVENCSRIS